MAYRKRTIRKLSPETRKFARLINSLEVTTRALKKRLEVIQRLELDSKALAVAHHQTARPKVDLAEWQQ